MNEASATPTMPYAIQKADLGVPTVDLPGGSFIALYDRRSTGSAPSKAPGDKPVPAVVICPGGGYGFLANDHEGAQVAAWFTSRGAKAFVLHYRVGPGHRYPEQLSDAFAAIEHIRDNAAEYGVDPCRVAIMGFSAGGHLAACAAVLAERDVCRPDLLILGYPVISMMEPYTHLGSRHNLLGPDADINLVRRLSVETQVTAQSPPAFIFHTEDDAAVPVENAVMLHSALRRAGVTSELHIYAHGPHGVGLCLFDPVLGSWPSLLDGWLVAMDYWRRA